MAGEQRENISGWIFSTKFGWSVDDDDDNDVSVDNDKDEDDNGNFDCDDMDDDDNEDNDVDDNDCKGGRPTHITATTSVVNLKTVKMLWMPVIVSLEIPSVSN